MTATLLIMLAIFVAYEAMQSLSGRRVIVKAVLDVPSNAE